MKTRTLLLTLALSAAALATSMAEVFSVKVVGYVKVTIPANSLALIANPLNGANNNLDAILPLKDDGTQDGVTIYRFDIISQSYANALSWAGNGPGAGGAWLSADCPDPTAPCDAKVISPGEGFFIYNITKAPIDLVFVGEVVQLPFCNPIPGNGALSIRSSVIPEENALGDRSSGLHFPAVDGMTVYIFDVATQAYSNAYGFVGTPGVDGQWLNATDPNPLGPVLPVAGSCFLINPGPTVNWGCPNPPVVHADSLRTFSVPK